MTKFEYSLKKACYRLWRTLESVDAVNENIYSFRGLHKDFKSAHLGEQGFLRIESYRNHRLFLYWLEDGKKEFSSFGTDTPEELYSFLKGRKGAFEFIEWSEGLLSFDEAYKNIETSLLNAKIQPLVVFHEIRSWDQVVRYEGRFIDYRIHPTWNRFPEIKLIDTNEIEHWKFISHIEPNGYITFD